MIGNKSLRTDKLINQGALFSWEYQSISWADVIFY